MHKTTNDIPEKCRAHMPSRLRERLAAPVDLVTHSKQAHWNVKGPNFIALHGLFDKVYENAGEYVDLIAERIMQLGGTSEGTVRVVAKRSQLPEYPLTI